MMKGTFGMHQGRSVVWMVGVMAALSFALICASAPAVRAETRLFEPALSLTGGCGTTKLDPVKDPWCASPPGPTAPFINPSIQIDSFGDMYVTSHLEEEGRVDVFSPTGQFITEVPATGAHSLAIDGEGNLYVARFSSGGSEPPDEVTRFTPKKYNPASEEIEYEVPGDIVLGKAGPETCIPLASTFTLPGLAVDPTTGHLFISFAGCVEEFSSAEEGNEPLGAAIGKGRLTAENKSVAVDAARNRLYVADNERNNLGQQNQASIVQVFELAAPHDYLGSIDGTAVPTDHEFTSNLGLITIAVDEETGNVFVSDLAGTDKVFEFGPGLGAEEEYFATYEHEFKYVEPGEIAVDNSTVSPNQGTLFIPAQGEAVNHTYAFKASGERPPVVESVSVSGLTEDEAALRAVINPEGAATQYRFEYTTRARFEAEEFTGAAVAGGGSLPSGVIGQSVTVRITGLAPGESYRFRAVAVNAKGEDEGRGGFRTYPSVPLSTCGNEALRTGFSAVLPDCRAYELVTPPATNGRATAGVGDTGIYFPTLQASPDGSKLTFRIEGGSLPGSEGSGAFNGENYLATRGSSGWSSRIAAPSGTEAISPSPGSASPDQEHSFWEGEFDGAPATFVRYPDGHSELVGRGSLTTDSRVFPDLITNEGGHIIFSTMPQETGHVPLQLEEEAPPKGTSAVYDRTADEHTHVVSLLPGNLTPAAGQDARYVGASFDGRGVAFTIGETLYLRYDNEKTYAIGQNLTFAGVAEGGGRIFYVEAGNLKAFDVASGKTIHFSSSGNVTPVNVSPDGHAAYFISPSVLTKEPNPNEEIAKIGHPNLYLSREGEVSFVATVTPLDVSEELPNGTHLGLGQWTQSLIFQKPALDSSRTAADGNVLLFQSRALLTEYDSGGHVEIYRYDSAGNSLSCLSCNPTEGPASSDASLQSLQTVSGPTTFMSAHAWVRNLRFDGKRAFFQSSEPLVARDVDGVQDVYEWEDQGVGSCQLSGGCVYLISSGQSSRDNRLFAISDSGDDVFFQSADMLVQADREETPSIYDAKVGGGFAEGRAAACEGEGCRQSLSTPPTLTTPATPVSGAHDNVQKRRCPRGKHKVKRHGRVRCAKKHRHHHAGKKGGKGK